MTPETDCPFCLAVGGTCHPHRTGVLRLLERADLYGPTILAWGKDGGPKGVRVTPPGGHPRTFLASDPRPRACLVSPCLNIGGADRWMLALMAETRDRLAWTSVVAVHQGQVVPAMAEEAAGLAPVLIGRTAIDAAIRASDIVVAWGVDAGELADRAACLGVPVLAVSHGVGPFAVETMASSARCAALAGVSRATLATFPEPERHRVRLIENCAEPARLEPRSSRESVRAAWGIAPGEKALITVGRMSPEKNPEAIADAVAELHRRGRREWRGVHVGAGWNEAATRSHAAAVAPGLVRFPGTTDDVAAAYLASDALALPSREEACALVMLEAWWVGVPLIAAAVGLTDEPEAAALCRIVRPGCSGVELADAVLADEADPEGTRDRAERARAVARERFGPERFGREWSDLIASIARPRPAPRQIDRSKPRMQLGVAQRPRPGCVSCAEQAAARIAAARPPA